MSFTLSYSMKLILTLRNFVVNFICRVNFCDFNCDVINLVEQKLNSHCLAFLAPIRSIPDFLSLKSIAFFFPRTYCVSIVYKPECFTFFMVTLTEHCLLSNW